MARTKQTARKTSSCTPPRGFQYQYFKKGSRLLGLGYHLVVDPEYDWSTTPIPDGFMLLPQRFLRIDEKLEEEEEDAEDEDEGDGHHSDLDESCHHCLCLTSASGSPCLGLGCQLLRLTFTVH